MWYSVLVILCYSKAMDAIDELLTRGVDTIYPSRQKLEKVLRSGKKLRLYQGFDPTGTQLHIGHAIALMKLRQFQELGHEVIFLIGDGTGQAGDPSGKTQAREKFYSTQELRNNARDYVKQASTIVKFDGPNPGKILYNSEWLNKLSLVEILEIVQHFSVQQFLERDMYEQRMKRGETINLREFLYPILQGYDSVAMNVDLELGGTDQTFNMLVGRELVRIMLHKQKFVMTVPLLTDAKGTKIGKTEGNFIPITDPPNDLFGKIMSFPDDIIVKGFELLTNIPMQEVCTIKQQLEKGENPINLKKKLASTLVAFYNSENDAKAAQAYFEKTVQQRELPAENVNVFMLKSLTTIAAAAIASGLAKSMSDLKRVVDQGGLYWNNKKVIRDQLDTAINEGDYLRRGSHQIIQVRYTI